jgi:plastocyanin
VILATALTLVTLASPGVAVGDNWFRPRSLAIRRGTAVTWRWRGRRRHNVFFLAGPPVRPRSCPARRSGSCIRRFSRAGRYKYVCTFHGTMAGAVRVR